MRIAVLSLWVLALATGAPALPAPPAPTPPPPLPDTPAQPAGPPHCTDTYGAFFLCPTDITPPKGATARCRDKSYFKGPRDPKACRGHGEVAFYLPEPQAEDAPPAPPSKKPGG